MIDKIIQIKSFPPAAGLAVAAMLVYVLSSVSYAAKDSVVSPPKTPVTVDAPNGVAARGGPMIGIEAGCFVMGGNAGDDDEKPPHRVCLDSYYIDIYEVTNANYDLCSAVGECPVAHYHDGTCYVTGESDWRSDRTVAPDFMKPDHPAVCIDYEQAANFCKWAGKRLPTEAEWEYAARGPDGRIYPWGDEPPTCRLAVMDDGGRGCTAQTTAAVGSRPDGASPFGLFDMAGNAWEWVADWYEADYYTASPERNPPGPESSSQGKRVFRGGSWYNTAHTLRSTYRTKYYLGYRYDYYGFRCAR